MISRLAIGLVPALAMAGTVSAQTPQAPTETPQQAKNREFILKHYPPGARQRGEQGKVAFKLTIEPDGTLGGCEVTESSGFAGLDSETCEILVRYGQLKPVVGADGRAIRAVQNGFIVWRLPPTSTVAAASTATTMAKPDEIICKSTPKTGSLIARTKQCMTKSEWLQTEQAWKEEMDRLQGKGHYAQSN